VDGKQFDGLIRAFGSGTSRRGVLGLLAAAAGLGLREDTANAKHHHGKGKGKGRGKHKQRAQGKSSPKCNPNSTCAKWCATTFGAGTTAANQCTSQATKCAGPCWECGKGCADKGTCTKTLCNGQCVAACPSGRVLNAQCQCVCASGTLCGSTCVDTQTDAHNCGTCSTNCTALSHAAQSTCSGGACQLVCDQGYANCDGNPSNGCETDITTTTNCGTCGVACRDDETCQSGSCQCPDGTKACSGTCTTIGTNTNCSDCNDVCGAAKSCQSGSCQCEAAGYTSCTPGGSCEPIPSGRCYYFLIDRYVEWDASYCGCKGADGCHPGGGNGSGGGCYKWTVGPDDPFTAWPAQP